MTGTSHTQQEIDAIDKAAADEMDATIDFAIGSDAPAQDAMFRDVFAPGEPEPEPLRHRLDRILARD